MAGERLERDVVARRNQLVEARRNADTSATARARLTLDLDGRSDEVAALEGLLVRWRRQ
jgi:hypothetical protein